MFVQEHVVIALKARYTILRQKFTLSRKEDFFFIGVHDTFTQAEDAAREAVRSFPKSRNWRSAAFMLVLVHSFSREQGEPFPLMEEIYTACEKLEEKYNMMCEVATYAPVETKSWTHSVWDKISEKRRDYLYRTGYW